MDDTSNPNRVLQFEWELYDTSGAPERLRTGIPQRQEPDTDLGIRLTENTSSYVIADIRPAVIEVPDMWSRTEHSGIQDLLTETIDIPVDDCGVPVLYVDLRNLLLMLLGL